MGICLRKSYYPQLTATQTKKLNELFEEVISNASVDYKNQEILDIKSAVREMLERVKDRINEREKFEISRIEPCGSMTEETAVWKYREKTGEIYTEFDFLAVLDYSPEIIRRDQGCRQCVGVREQPVPITMLHEDGVLRSERYANRGQCDSSFLNELNTCLGCDNNCYSVEHNETRNSYSFSLAYACTPDYMCEKCVVVRDTGILRVCDSVSVGPHGGDAECSIVFMWTSNENTLSVCDNLFQEKPKQINSLPIHVDFLPALEIFKAKTGKVAHDFFLVPKRCNICRGSETWRKSNCVAETLHIEKKMSEKHKKCYKFIKYYLSLTSIADRLKIKNINWYNVKIAALNHSRQCSDSSDACAECVLNILTELKHAYATKTLTSFHDPNVNMFVQPNLNIGGRIFQKAIERLCSVQNTDTIIDFIPFSL